MSSNSSIVKLNIGGTLFQTSKSTLTRYNGFFRTMFETDIPVTKDESGAIFIDRNPKHFAAILDFMRDGHVELPESEKEMKELRNEAQYYLLDGLVELCAPKIPLSGVRTIKCDAELVELIINPKKPVLVLQCPLFCTGNIYYPSEIDLSDFIKRYKYQVDIVIRTFPVDKLGMYKWWRWALYDGKSAQFSPSDPMKGGFNLLREALAKLNC